TTFGSSFGLDAGSCPPSSAGDRQVATFKFTSARARVPPTPFQSSMAPSLQLLSSIWDGSFFEEPELDRRRKMPDDDFGEPPSDLRGLSPPRGVRHVIAVAGGRGGVGASVMAVNLAVYLAQLGRKVTLIDTDPAGGQLHTMLGVSMPPYRG